MIDYEVTIIARRVVDVTARIKIRAMNKKAAKAQAQVMIANDDPSLADDKFEAVDSPRMMSMTVEGVEPLGRAGDVNAR